MAEDKHLKVLADGLSFPEGPRWYAGALYFSDFYTHRVHKLAPDGELNVVTTVPNQPSGLGWLPDGRMLIVSMLDRKLVRLEPDGRLVEHADLNAVATWHCNDMVVDSCGRAYVGNFGFDTHTPDTAPIKANLAMVSPDGSVTRAAEGFWFPNGSVITPDGRTLVVAETRANRLTAFEIGREGELGARRVWADLGVHFPDGIALDAQGQIWVADPRNRCLIRVAEGGDITSKVELDRGAYACALGGIDGHTLYVCAATGSGKHAKSRLEGQILAMRVDVPAA